MPQKNSFRRFNRQIPDLVICGNPPDLDSDDEAMIICKAFSSYIYILYFPAKRTHDPYINSLCIMENKNKSTRRAFIRNTCLTGIAAGLQAPLIAAAAKMTTEIPKGLVSDSISMII